MSRSNYSDDLDNWSMVCWAGAVKKAIRGKRGQALLREMEAALVAMPVKELIAHELESTDGGVCALGCLGRARKLNMSKLDPDEPESVACAFGVAPALVQEIVYQNDEQWDIKTPAQRYEWILKWVREQIDFKGA